MDPKIQLSGVSKAYHVSTAEPLPLLRQILANPAAGMRRSVTTKVAVDNVSLSMGAGERVGIIGRNGAGKTTLLKILAGLAEPSSGEIAVEGHVTAIMTLGLGLREDLTGRENIYVDGEMKGRSRDEIERMIDDVIAFADLGEFIEYPVRTYSTGMKARLAFATTMHIVPEILLIDEALSVGDVAFALKATAQIRELCETGKIVVIVSHSMESVVDICNRCLWMEDGRIVMDGDPSAVTRAYVESVRRKDEEAVLERFRRLVGAKSYRPGCEISHLAVGHAAGGDVIVEAGKDLLLEVTLQIGAVLGTPDLRLRIIRLDGLVVTENRLSEEGGAAGGAVRGAVGYTIEMRPLVLGPGVYQVVVELLEMGEVVAERSTVVEVVASLVPTGGRPALLYPCSVTAQPVGG